MFPAASPTTWRTQLSTDGWLDKETVVYIHSGIPLSHEKEWDPAIGDNTDGPQGHHAKWNKSDRERQIPHDLFYMWKPNIYRFKKKNKKKNKLIDLENRLVATRGKR